jgi:hypothetical protein
MRIHVLKTWSPWFEAHRDGLKPWELRRDDRGYQVGDFLVLRKFEPEARVPGLATGPSRGTWGEEYTVSRVIYVARGDVPPLGLVPTGYVLMTLADVSDQEFVEVMGRVTTDNEGGIWAGVGALGVR